MPNPVAANDSTPISGSLQTSRISYGVDLIGKNYGQNYNGTKWYSDIPNDGTYYTIVSDNYTANYYISRSLAGSAYVEGGQPAVDEFSAPVFWTTQGTSSADIIAVVNGLPDRKGQTVFTTGEQALNWIASSGNYFAIGPDYFKQTNTDGLILNVEGNQIISYPTTGSTWYDLSGFGNDGTLQNGVRWNINGWLDFDGADDLVSISMIPLTDFTITQVLYMDNVDNQMPIGGGLYSNGADYRGYVWFFKGVNQVRVKVDGETGPDFGVNVGAWADKWISYTATRTGDTYKLYINGQQVDQTRTGSTNQFSVRTIGWGYSNSYAMQGDLSLTKIYNRELTSDEITQNYFGGPIVTDGLVYALDAGNLVSYPRNGVDIFDLTTQIPGVLTNGTTFSKEYGGSFELDGVDDFISTEFTDTFQEEITVEIWYRGTKTARNHVWDIGTYTADANLSFDFNDGYDLWVYWNGGGGNRVRYNIPGGFTNGEINHLVYTHIADVNKVYLNGEELTITEQGGAQEFTQPVGGTMQLGRIGSGLNFEGSIYSYRVYNRYLTQQEIQQNYNATK